MTTRRLIAPSILSVLALNVIIGGARASATYSFEGSTPDPIDGIIAPSNPRIPMNLSQTYTPDLSLVNHSDDAPTLPGGLSLYQGPGTSISMNFDGHSVTSDDLRFFQVMGRSVEIVYNLPTGFVELTGTLAAPTPNDSLPPTLDAGRFTGLNVFYYGTFAGPAGTDFTIDPPQVGAATPTPEPSTLVVLGVGVAAVAIRSRRGRPTSRARSKGAREIRG